MPLMLQRFGLGIRWLARVAGIGVPLLWSMSALAQQTYQLSIPAQELGNALKEFSTATNQQVLFSHSAVAGRRSVTVEGEYTPDAALEVLLHDSGLRVERTSAGVLLIKSTADDPGAHSNALEEVIVTAQKRTENVQDVPASVHVLSGELLAKVGAQQTSDYAAYIPGFSIINIGAPGRNQLTIRGITTGPSDNSTVGIYVDDAPFGSSTSNGNGGTLALDLLPYDVERIEVLRGPQGTLYGANAMGGLLKYVTRTPDLNQTRFDVGGEASSTRGSDALGWIARASANVPLVTDRLAVSASYFHRDIAGVIDNAAGRRDENEGEQEGGRVALLWAAADNVTVKLAALLQDINVAGGGAAVPVSRATRQPVYGDLVASYPLQQQSDQRVRYYSGTVNWDFDWASLTSVSSYSTLDVDGIVDSSAGLGRLFGPGTRVGLRTLVDLKKYTQEFRLASPGERRFEWLLGGFYTSEDSSFAQVGPAMDSAGTPLPGVNPLIDAALPSEYRELSFFGDATWRFTDRFDLTAGVRHSHNSQSFTASTAGFLFNFPVGRPPGFVEETAGRSSEDVVTYMVSPRYHVSEDIMIYARAASGYRPGGPNVALPGTPASFDADRLTNYEVGLKSQLLDRRVLLDVSLYYIDWKDIQVQLTGSTNLGFRSNAGDAVSKGVELSAAYAPTRNLRLGVNASYTDAAMEEDVPALFARKGDSVPTVPKWGASMTADYEFALWGDVGGELGGGYRYVGGSHYPFASNPSTYRLDAYDVLDLYAGVTVSRWTARLFVRNVTDERAYVSVLGGAPPGAVRLTVNQPRTIGASIDARF